MGCRNLKDFVNQFENLGKTVLEIFERLYAKKLKFDCTLACADGNVLAHKYILACYSPFFKRCLDLLTDEAFKVSPNVTLFLPDVHYDHMFAIVEFMYTGKLGISLGSFLSVVRTARRLRVNHLQDAQFDYAGSKFVDAMCVPPEISVKFTSKSSTDNHNGTQRKENRYPSTDMETRGTTNNQDKLTADNGGTRKVVLPLEAAKAKQTVDSVGKLREVQHSVARGRKSGAVVVVLKEKTTTVDKRVPVVVYTSSREEIDSSKTRCGRKPQPGSRKRRTTRKDACTPRKRVRFVGTNPLVL